eukprot:m.73941 g.73941  ORF g.73941 m.73941 type:complete len:66 (+) comp8041_c0_seq1:306-503(+)
MEAPLSCVDRGNTTQSLSMTRVLQSDRAPAANQILELIDSDEFEDRPSASHTTVRSEELSLLSAF